VEQLGSAIGIATVGKVEGLAEENATKLGLMELKKMNTHLLKLVDPKKQQNLMAGIFYFLYNFSQFCLSPDH
jgi:hypothetical protein